MSVMPHRGCDCCVVYGPRRPLPLPEVRAEARREAAAMLATPEGQEMLEQLRLDVAKRQLGQALGELLFGEEA